MSKLTRKDKIAKTNALRQLDKQKIPYINSHL